MKAKVINVIRTHMTVLLYLLPIALFILLLAVLLFLWFVRNDQFDDLDKAANQILRDDFIDEEKK